MYPHTHLFNCGLTFLTCSSAFFPSLPLPRSPGPQAPSLPVLFSLARVISPVSMVLPSPKPASQPAGVSPCVSIFSFFTLLTNNSCPVCVQQFRDVLFPVAD
jgi:hypothetical protein